MPACLPDPPVCLLGLDVYTMSAPSPMALIAWIPAEKRSECTATASITVPFSLYHSLPHSLVPLLAAPRQPVVRDWEEKTETPAVVLMIVMED